MRTAFRVPALLFALAATSAAASTTLAAQAAVRPTFGVSGGATFPLGDFGDAVETGYNIGAHVGFRPAMLPVGLRVEGMFNRFAIKNFGNANATIWAGTANAIIQGASAPGMVRPYLIGGLGVYNNRVEQTAGGVSVSTSDTKFGLNGGAGLDIGLSGIGVFVEARYHYIFTDDNTAGSANTAIVPLTVGIRF